MSSSTWESHYTNEKSELLYPDENLVRLLKKNLPGIADLSSAIALDMGCGSGRHLALLTQLNIRRIIGIDSSQNALLLAQKHFPGALLQADNRNLPIKNDSINIVIAWGSLHYNRKYDLVLMLEEIIRLLKKDGHLFATLRSDRDTFMKRGEHLGDNTWKTDLHDISGSIVSFYHEDELRRAFSLFSHFQYGLMERTLIGDLSSIISHWVIHAQK